MAAPRSTRLVTRAALAALADAVLRASPRYRMVRAATGRRADPSAVGVTLQPRDGTGLPPTLLDGPTASLLRRLRTPAPLPEDLRAALGDEAGREVARLVFDGLLEARLGRAWVSGPAALTHFAPRTGLAPAGGARNRLSRDALAYGERLGLRDVPALAERLYRYNTVPDAPTALAGVTPEGLLSACAAAARRAGWHRGSRRSSQRWRSWTRGRAAPGGMLYKLYVSPSCRALAGAMPRIARALSSTSALAWKVGADRPGWLRPDKIVAYFATRHELLDGAKVLRAALRGVPGHGVPFSAALTTDGLLSWGVDRPIGERMPGMEETESWRVRLTHVLARALVLASLAPARASATDVALIRLALDGVDPLTFAPLDA